ncbi:MAG: hypothetical protein WD768_04120 [Phycisphaeraceae bacterium]
MEISQFIAHHGLSENPFTAEEARFDPVFDRLTTKSTTHQDFDKILGDIARPSTAVVFGEKGSGKTAIRLRIAQLVAEYNTAHPDQRTLLVAYDDLNPVLDRIAQRHQRGMSFNKASRTGAEKLLSHTRLADHQDAILSLAVTRLLDGVLGATGEGSAAMPADVEKKVKTMPRDLRTDLAVLAALYDQPRSGTVATRWGQLRRKLKLRFLPPAPYFRYANISLSLITLVCWLSASVFSWGEGGPPGWLAPLAWITGIGAAVGWVVWGWSRFVLWKLCHNIQKDVHAVQRQTRDLMNMLLELKGSDIAPQPWPVPGVQGEHDSRFQLTHKLMNILQHFGYTGMMVLVDRVDEPSLVAGKPECMKPVVWPMLDHKFLQQDRVGLKLLLPIELRHLVHREDTNFFQQSRLDKQNMVDRLTWSGATLYDMCTNRLRACRKANGASTESGGEAASGGSLRDLFAQDVTRQQLVEALDQMHQPRDAFKFLYAVIQEHCRTVSQDEADYLIPRLTLEGIRRQQAQRVQDLQRGMTPS